MVSGQVPLSVQSTPSSLAFIRAGKLKVIGVVNEKRLAALPDSPTIGETLKGFGATPWYAMFAPTGTPKAVTTWLQVEVNKVLDDHDAIAKLATLGCEPYKGNPDSLNQLVQFDLVRVMRALSAKKTFSNSSALSCEGSMPWESSRWRTTS